MIHVFEKVCKTDLNRYGIREITDENPLTKGPCVITILPSTPHISHINGALRQVANLVNPDIDTNYDPDRRLLGLGYGQYLEDGRISDEAPTGEELIDFLNKYFYPLFMENGNKIDVLTAMKNCRNVTFLTFCDGAERFKILEFKIRNKMKEIGYTDDEVGMILSQICLAAISGKVLTSAKTSVLAITFGDVNDSKYEHNLNTIDGINKLGQGYINYGYSLGFAISGSGNHDFKEHMTGNPILSSRIKAFLNTSLENALENRYNDVIDPITYEKMERAFNNIEESQTKLL